MMTLDALAERIQASPFNRWIGLYPVSIDACGVTLGLTTRPEMIGSLATGALHGGVLAALIDAVCSYAWLVRSAGFVSTVDLRTDFHRPLKPGKVILRGHIVRAGQRIVTADARVTDAEDRLVASGRAVMMPVSLSQSDGQRHESKPGG